MRVDLNDNPLDSNLGSTTPLGAEAPKEPVLRLPEIARRRSEPVLALPEPGAERGAALQAQGIAANSLTGAQASQQLRDLSLLGLPPDVALSMPAAVAGYRKEREQVEFAKKVGNNTALSAWAQKNPQYMAIARDEEPALTSVEKLLKGAGQAYNRGALQNQLSDLGGEVWKGTHTYETLEQIRKIEDAMAVGGELGADSLPAEMLFVTAQGLPPMLRTIRRAAGTGMVTGMAAAAPALLSGVGAAAAPALFAAGLTGGTIVRSGIEEGRMERNLALLEYQKIQDEAGQKIDGRVARVAAQAVGVVNGVQGAAQVKIGISFVPGAKKLVGVGLRREVAKALAEPTVRAALLGVAVKFGVGLSGEVTTEVGQRAWTILGEQIARQQSGIDLQGAGETATELADEAFGALKAFPAMMAPGAAVNAVIDVHEARRAQNPPSDVIRQVGEAWKAAASASAVPGDSEAFVRDAAERGGKPTIYAPVGGWNQYWQGENEDPKQKAAELGVSSEAYDEAMAADGRLAIPTEKWVTRLGATEHNEALSESVVFDAGHLTEVELDELAESARELATEEATTDTKRTPLDDFRDEITGQLLGVGYTQEAAEIQADLMARGYGARVAMGGQGLEELRQKFDPIIKRNLPGLKEIGKNTQLESMIYRLQQGDWPADEAMYGRSLLQFIRDKGGMKLDAGGDLFNKGLGRRGKKSKGIDPFLISAKGKPLDYMRELAEESGYLPENSDINDLLDALDRELGGAPVYSTQNQKNRQMRLAGMTRTMTEIADTLELLGIDLNGATAAEIAKALQESAAQRVMESEGGVTFDQPVYHGSPHKFDAFDLGKIGTGEGAQAYGYGLYFAENPKVAGSYRTAGATVDVKNDAIDYMLAAPAERRHSVIEYLENEWAPKQANRRVPTGAVRDALQKLQGDDEALGLLKKLDQIEEHTHPWNEVYTKLHDRMDDVSGNLYQVDIQDDQIAKMLDWDKPLSEQAPEVRKILEKNQFLIPENADVTGGELYNFIAGENMRTQAVEGKAGEIASKRLKELGIPGIKYLDGGSRGPTQMQYDDIIKTFGGVDKEAALSAAKAQLAKYGKAGGPKSLYAQKAIDALNAGPPTRNIVVFDQTLLNEINKSLKTLYQRKQGEKRGGITFQNGQAIITMFQANDRSTFLHETGHLFLEMLRDAAQMQTAPEQAKADMAALLKWFGLEYADQITVTHHEKFAEGFEKYLAEGKAPTPSLAHAFATFAAWLKRIYRGLVYADVKISDDVRGVMDRMIATEEEIRDAQAERGDLDLYMEIEKQNLLDPEHLEKYRARLQAAHDDAVAKQTARLLRSAEKADEDWYKAERAKVEEEVAATLRKRPVYIAISALSKQQRPDGTPIQLRVKREYNAQGEVAKETPIKLKLDSNEIVEFYGKYVAAKKGEPNPITNKLHAMGVYSATDGMALDVAANGFGFSSGDAMIQEMVAVEPLETAIQTETDREMYERYPDERFDGTLAIDAVNQVDSGETRQEVMAAELAALKSIAAGVNKVLGVEKKKEKRGMRRALFKGFTIEQARSYARNVMLKKKVGDIKAEPYRKTARMHGLLTVKMVGEKDYESAYQHKARELINQALFEEARKVEKEIASHRAEMQAMTTKKFRANIGKAGEDMLDALDALLAKVNLRPKSQNFLKNADAIASYVRQTMNNDAIEGFKIPLSLSRMALGQEKPYQLMTLEEFRALYDDATSIAALARVMNQLLASDRKQTLDAAIEELSTSIAGNARTGRSAELAEPRLPRYQFSRAVKGFVAAHRNFASWIYELDGFKAIGAGYQLLTTGLQKASDTQAELHHKINKALTEIVEMYSAVEWTSMQTPKAITGTTLSLSHVGRLMTVLHSGNAHNRRLMLEGGIEKGKMDERTLQIIIDTLDERDWKFVQSIWRYIDTFYDPVATIEKRIRGIAAKRVEPITIMTKYGPQQGGYLPISRESRKATSKANAEMESDLESLLSGSGQQLLPDRSFMHERTPGATHGPLRIDFGVVTSHLSAVAHYIAFYEYLMDAGRLLGSEKVKTTIKSIYGDVVYSQLVNALRDVAAGESPVHEYYDSLVRHLRTATSVGAMTFNALTVAVQAIGIIPALRRVGVGWMVRGLSAARGGARSVTDVPEKMLAARAWIDSSSVFMRNRSKTQNREIAEVQQRAMSPDLLSRYGREALHWGYYGIMALQRQVDVVVWQGAYEKAIALKSEGGLELDDHEAAVLYADRQVRDTQASGQLADQSTVMRSKAAGQLFTVMFSYFNQMEMLMAEETNRARLTNTPQAWASAVAGYMAIFVIPTVLTQAMYAAMRGDWDDKDEDEILKVIGKSLLAGSLSFHAGARELTGVVQGWDYGGPTGLKPVKDFAKFIKQVGQFKADEAFFHSLLQAIGAVVPLPSTAMWRLYQGLNGESDERPAWLVALVGEPPKGK